MWSERILRRIRAHRGPVVLLGSPEDGASYLIAALGEPRRPLIWDNILWSRPEAGEAEMRAAARAANVVEFVDQLPGGYDTWVGERGVTLSRGQCQRIAIARMLLKAPQILIFDESTPSLDTANESLVQEAMRHLVEGRTSFIISHRATSIRDVDRILVLVDGQLVEDGAHEDLLAQGGLYARLFQPQLVR
jgi:ABC-type multidrug transport system fused ATPase/permease subunit